MERPPLCELPTLPLSEQEHKTNRVQSAVRLARIQFRLSAPPCSTRVCWPHPGRSGVTHGNSRRQRLTLELRELGFSLAVPLCFGLALLFRVAVLAAEEGVARLVQFVLQGRQQTAVVRPRSLSRGAPTMPVL